MAGKRGAGEGTFWKKSNGRWYGKRCIGPPGTVVTINGSGATRTEAVADVRAKVDQHPQGVEAPHPTCAGTHWPGSRPR